MPWGFKVGFALEFSPDALRELKKLDNSMILLALQNIAELSGYLEYFLPKPSVETFPSHIFI